MTPDQLDQKEKARVVAVAVAADASSSFTTTAEAPPPARARKSDSSNSSSSKKRFSLAFAPCSAPASSASGAKPASSAAADALHFYARTLPTSLAVVVMMICLYSATAYGLPHVLCKSTATDEVREKEFFSRPFASASRRGE